MASDDRTINRQLNNIEWANSNGSFVAIENARCPHHYKLPIQYFCLDCMTGEGCFCSECALTRHSKCDVRTLDESFTVILNNYINKWISQLSTRSENLEITFTQTLKDKREEWAVKLQGSLLNLTKTSNDVNSNLKALEDELIEWINKNHQIVTDNYNDMRNDVDTILKSYLKNATLLREQRKLAPTKLLHFYNQNYKTLRQYLLGDTPRDSESLIKAIPAQLKHSIELINQSFLQVSNVLNNLEHNIRHVHEIETTQI